MLSSHPLPNTVGQAQGPFSGFFFHHSLFCASACSAASPLPPPAPAPPASWLLLKHLGPLPLLFPRPGCPAAPALPSPPFGVCPNATFSGQPSPPGKSNAPLVLSTPDPVSTLDFLSTQDQTPGQTLLAFFPLPSPLACQRHRSSGRLHLVY